MTADYKNRLNRKRKQKPVPGWVWMLCGIGMGLMAAGLMYLKSSMPIKANLKKEAVIARQSAQERHKQDKKPSPRPRFEFYTILPEMEVVVPDYEITGPSHRGVRQVEEKGTYVLQAGSFRSPEQADSLRARLTLLGLDASIQTVTVGQNETWHRVRAGPYDNLELLNKARIRLREHRIDTILLREKDEQ